MDKTKNFYTLIDSENNKEYLFLPYYENTIKCDLYLYEIFLQIKQHLKQYRSKNSLIYDSDGNIKE